LCLTPQNSVPSEQITCILSSSRSLQVCAQYNITAIAFLPAFGQSAPLLPNIAGHNISKVGAAITTCQSYGTKILLSMGGQAGVCLLLTLRTPPGLQLQTFASLYCLSSCLSQQEGAAGTYASFLNLTCAV